MVSERVAAASNPITMRRIVVGLIVAAVGLGAIIYPYAFYVLVLAIALASLYELNKLCAIKGQELEYPVAVLGVAAYIVLAVFAGIHKWEGALLAAIIIATFWLGMYGEQKGYFARTAYTLLAVLYIGKLLSYFIFIRQVPQTGMWLTLYVAVIIALTDILGMVIGTFAGRTPITKISPKKTAEGSIGAIIIVAAIAAMLAASFHELHLLWWQGAVLGVLTSIAAQAGDLVESALKRDAGVKDTGTVIVGHGGVLDRFDSYLFGGMTFFGGLHLLGILSVR
jgi:phosphatidate cytidylyltransferase